MKTITLENVSIVNFKKFDVFSLNFNGLQLITGPNGSGKSSIFEAVYVALYGRRPNGKPATSAIKVGETFSELELNFLVDNDSYKVQRRIGKQSTFVLYHNDQLASKTASKTKEIVENLIPNEIVKLSMLQDVDIRKILLEYIDINIDEIVTKLRDKEKELQGNLIQLQSELTAKQTEKDMLENRKQEIKNKLDQLAITLKEMYDEIQDMNNQLQGLDILQNKINQYQELYQQVYNSELGKLYEEQKKIEDDINKTVHYLIQEKNQLEQEFKNLQTKYELELKQFEEILYNDFTELWQLQEKLPTIEFELNYLHNGLKQKEDELDQLNKSIQETGTCYVCGQPLTDLESIEKHRSEITYEIGQIQDKINHLKEEFDNMVNRINDLEAEYTKRKEDVKRTLDVQYQEKKEKIARKVKQIDKEIEEYAQKIVEIRKTYQHKQSLLIDMVKKDVMDKLGLQEEDFQRLTELLNLKDTYNEQVSTYNTLYKQWEELTNEFKEIEDKISTISIDDSKLTETSNTINILNDLSNTRLWNKLLIKRIVGSVNSLIEKEDLPIDIKLEIDDKDNLQIFVTNLNGEVVPIENLSQGETVLAKLVLFDAIRKLISSSIRFNTWFLDEVIDRLDSDNIKLVTDYLRKKVGEEGYNILVITHNTYAQDLDVWDEVIDLTQLTS